MMETQNNFIFALLMLISTCSQNLMDTVNELSTDNNLKNKEIIKYDILIDKSGALLLKDNPRTVREIIAIISSSVIIAILFS